MNKLSFQPGSSFFHQLFPLTKLLWLILGSIFVLLNKNSTLLILFSMLCIFLVWWIDHNFYNIRGIRLVFMTAFTLMMMHILFNKSGELIIEFPVKIFNLTTEGLQFGILFSARFLSVVFLSYLFVLTTNPSDLAYAFMKIGIPYRWGFMLVMALRLSPIMEYEGKTIYRAQLARGVRYDQKSLKKFLLLIQQFITPVLISALRRADKLVFSMEGRGFGKYAHRTFIQKTNFSWRDVIALVCLPVIIFLFIIV
jgi:energy-coupling factor transport system permease protein